MLNPITALLNFILDIYAWVVFIYVIMQLLSYFNVINTNEPLVVKIMKIFAGLCEPILSRIRRYIGIYNNFDFSPLILLLALKFIQYCLIYYFA